MEYQAFDAPQPQALQYWHEDDGRRSQRYYVALCLLMAAIQDAVLGRAEQKFQNLNWSATVSYYSLVHTGRLICFVAVGDYPTQHYQLRSLFSGQNVALNWLDAHRELADQARPLRQRTGFDEVSTRLDRLGVGDSEGRLRRFGELLTASADLRNDSNYEALLVAHEYRHGLVSPAFEKLSAALGAAAEESLWLAIDAFNALRRDAPTTLGPGIEGLIYAFMHDRLEPALAKKVGTYGESKRLLDSISLRLQLDSRAPRDSELERSLAIQYFTGKTELMQRFRQRIMRLEEALGSPDHRDWEGWYVMPDGLPHALV